MQCSVVRAHSAWGWTRRTFMQSFIWMLLQRPKLIYKKQAEAAEMAPLRREFFCGATQTVSRLLSFRKGRVNGCLKHLQKVQRVADRCCSMHSVVNKRHVTAVMYVNGTGLHLLQKTRYSCCRTYTGTAGYIIAMNDTEVLKVSSTDAIENSSA